MFARLGVVVAFAAFLMAGTGCQTSKTTAEIDSLRQQNKQLAEKVEASEKARTDAEARAAVTVGQPTETVATPGMGDNGGALDMSNIRPVRPTGSAAGRPSTGSTAARPTAPNVPGVSTHTNAAGEVVLEIPGDVLFDSGKVSIKPAAQKTLDTIAATIKSKYPGQSIRIEGHTDSTPIKNSAWSDNYDLGFARANAVLHYLSKKGISEKSMHPASFGANVPVSTKNQALNRRVEIVVVKNGK